MGKFVTFEGGEGSGKSTLIQNLRNYLDEHKVDYVITREPGGLKLCEDIRNILKYSTEKIGLRAELLLFSASRAQLVDDFIRPNLDAGKLVLCDRFFDSTRVYQGYAANVDDAEVMKITNFATAGLVPDLTFYLDIDPMVAFKRKGGQDKGDRIEERDLSFHYLVRDGYRAIAAKEKRFVVLDATKSPQEIVDQVIEKLRTENIIE
ncbi:MAG: dTMP kinase [Clostridia bacterium]|nr:dTMP kinase [Clostridia bacterium]